MGKNIATPDEANRRSPRLTYGADVTMASGEKPEKSEGHIRVVAFVGVSAVTVTAAHRVRNSAGGARA